MKVRTTNSLPNRISISLRTLVQSLAFSAILTPLLLTVPSAGQSLDPTPPQLWVKNHESDLPPTGVVTKYLGNTCPTSPGGLCDYPGTITGLQASMDDWAGAPDQWTHVIVTHGTTITSSSPFILRAKAGATKWIVYESDTPLLYGRTVCSHGIEDNLAGLSDIGTRNPGCTTDLASMWTLESSNSVSTQGSVIQVGLVASGNGASHIVIRDAEIRPASSVTASIVPIYLLSQPQNTTASAPSRIGFDRVYLHGDASHTAFGNNKIVTFIKMGCSYCWLMNSYTENTVKPGSESHVVGILNGPGPMKIVHNWIEGAAIGIMTGAGIPEITDLVTGDVEIRRNRITSDLNWCPAPAGAGVVDAGNHGPGYKNRIEYKAIQRSVLDGNIIENSCADGQSGLLQSVNVRACSGSVGGCTGGENLFTSDVTNTNNIYRHATEGVQTSGRSGGTNNGNGVSLPGNKWLWENNLIYDIGDHARFNGSGTVEMWQVGAAGNQFSGNVTRDHAGLTSTITLTAIDSGTLIQSGMSTGDLIYVHGCTDSSFDTPAGIGPQITSANPHALTITYPNSGPGDVSTTCTLDGAGTNGIFNRQGWAKNVVWNHNTAVGSGQFFVGCVGSSPGPSNFVQNATYTNSFQVQDTASGGGSIGGIRCTGTGFGEGTATETKTFQLTTFNFNNTVISLRTASNYTEYGGAHNGASPPSTVYFPANNSCPTATADLSCLGMKGMMSGAPYDLNDADYHKYLLATSSCFRAGVSCGGTTHAGSDGKNIGPDFSALDAAIERKRYVCRSSCGTGPQLD
jgi:hypothetical protein